MSGQATGWVLRHGPKDRAMRAVLITIADAANRDGEHAYPGLEAMIDGSLYGRSHVLATLKKLTAEGWLEVEEEGRGRGHATVYRVCMDRTEKVQPVDLSYDGEKVHSRADLSGSEKGQSGTLKGTIQGEKRANLDEEKGQSGHRTLSSPTVTNNNGKPSTETDNGKANAPSGAAAASGEDKNHPDYGFDRFWTRYPKRDGKRGSKAKAIALWRHMTYTHKAEAWRQLGIYLRVVEAGRPAMDAERWLRKGRDEGWDPAEGWDASGSRPTANGARPAFETEDPTAATVERWKPLQDAAEQEFIKASAAVVEQMRNATRKGPE